MEIEIRLNNDSEARNLLGKHDKNLKTVENAFSIKSVLRNGILRISGDEENVKKVKRLLEELLITVREGGFIRKHDLNYCIKTVKENSEADLHSIYLDKIEVSSKRQYVTPKSRGQKEYVDAIRDYDVVFSVGPAGTGKTYLAMAMAVNALRKGLVSRIILTRPAVEAGESLGFLPGDMKEKVMPYLRPLYDALYDMLEIDSFENFIERGIIEIAPLAFMRGRTLNDSFIILDEAQNSTPEQMKMFLTRLGFDSKTVITGDITQSDLPEGKKSGLVQAASLFKGIRGIKFIHLKGEDVVRHELVQEIIRAYEKLKTEETK